ncbi:helicase associated domain-containing protein [Streptomyces sp. NPDC093546]|uniref:helicase associated domain-containing protein n=1 Tax=Streptomyces sp. NPDC093546 TaxID=3366040 RepID=UPI00381FE8E7
MKLKQYAEREGHARVSYGHKGGAYPLGQWVAEQRSARYDGERAAALPCPGRARELLDGPRDLLHQHRQLTGPGHHITRPAWLNLA